MPRAFAPYPDSPRAPAEWGVLTDDLRPWVVEVTSLHPTDPGVASILASRLRERFLMERNLAESPMALHPTDPGAASILASRLCELPLMERDLAESLMDQYHPQLRSLGLNLSPGRRCVPMPGELLARLGITTHLSRNLPCTIRSFGFRMIFKLCAMHPV